MTSEDYNSLRWNTEQARLSEERDSAEDLATSADGSVTAGIDHHMSRAPDSVAREGRDGRSIVARWVLRENADGTRECATLYSLHFRGWYRAVVNRTQYQPDRGNGVTGELSAPMDTVEVLRRPTKRYSARALDAFAAEAIAVINDPGSRARFGVKFDADTPV